MPSETVPTIPGNSRPEASDVWPGLPSQQAREELLQICRNEILTSSGFETASNRVELEVQGGVGRVTLVQSGR